MKPLLVGEANPHSENPRRALAPLPRGAAGDRLRAILGMTDREYMRAFVRTNVCRGPWDERQAKLNAGALLLGPFHPGPYILLGRKVCAAFGVPYLPFKRQRYGSRPWEFLVLPHPSGRCRAWNDPRATTRTRRVVRGMIREMEEVG